MAAFCPVRRFLKSLADVSISLWRKPWSLTLFTWKSAATMASSITGTKFSTGWAMIPKAMGYSGLATCGSTTAIVLVYTSGRLDPLPGWAILRRPLFGLSKPSFRPGPNC